MILSFRASSMVIPTRFGLQNQLFYSDRLCQPGTRTCWVRFWKYTSYICSIFLRKRSSRSHTRIIRTSFKDNLWPTSCLNSYTLFSMAIFVCTGWQEKTINNLLDLIRIESQSTASRSERIIR